MSHFNVFIACFVDKVPRVTGYKELEVGQLSYSKVTVNFVVSNFGIVLSFFNSFSSQRGA